jgi:predicted transcriptional regulator
MAVTDALTVHLPVDVKRRLGRLAESTNKTETALATKAIADYVKRELDIIEGIKRSLEDAKAGRVVPHDQAMTELEATIAKASARTAK